MRLINLVMLLFLAVSVFAQQPQTSDVSNTQPLYAVNAKYTNGVGPGYWPTAGAGLTLNISTGTCFDSTQTRHTYAGGSTVMVNNATNYVSLTAAGCVLQNNTVGYGTDIPIAMVTTLSGAITAIADDRTLFKGSGGGGGVTSIATTTPISGGTITTTGTITCPTCAIGPGSSTANHLALFSGTDGVTLIDGGANTTGTVTSVTASSPLASSGGTTPDITHNTSGVTAASYTNSDITVDAYGHVTAASNGTSGGSGGYTNSGIGPATVPTVTTTGSAGSTAYTYCVVANLTATTGTSGGTTACSPALRLTTGNATLTSSNYNNISWTAVSGANSYDIYRVISGGTPATVGKLTSGDCVAVAGVSCHDKGETADSAAAPTQNTTGQTTAYSFAAGAGGFQLNDPTHQVRLVDEFCGTGGDLKWTTTGTITVSYLAGSDANRPCVVELNGNGTTGTLALGNGQGAMYLNSAAPMTVRFYAKMSSFGTTGNRCQQQIGLVSGNGLTNPNSGGTFIAFMGCSRSGTGTNFGCSTGGSGLGYNELNTGIAQNTNWHWFEIDIAPLDSTGNNSPSGSVVIFKMDHSVVCTSLGTNIYIANGVSPFIGVASTGANGVIDVDYFDLTSVVNRP